jgi:exodeoxyribonuclease V beta subunit
MTEHDNNEFKISEFDPKDSLYIEASAGTGKTYTIQLMVAQMIADDTPLKKILIVTYTDKAAGELKDRIRKKIDEVLEKGVVDKSLPRLTKDQLGLFRKAYQDVDNAAIFTIHSFCQKALREYAYDAGRSFDMVKIDDKAVENLVEQFIRDKWKDDEDFKALVLGEEKISTFMDGLKEQFVNAVNLYKGTDSDGNEIVKLDSVVLPKLGDEDVPMDKMRQIVSAQNLSDLNVISDFEESVNAFLNAAENDEKAKNFVGQLQLWSPGKKMFDGRAFRKFNGALEKPFERIKAVNNYLTDVKKALKNKFLTEWTPKVFEAWQKYKADNKLQSFNDMILSMHQAVLASDNLLKTRLRSQYKYAIIDEFQDTNQLQWDIFRNVFLKEGNKRIEGHSIFVVGDPKQSIYSFQGADVNVYKKAIGEIGVGKPLVHNYRSTDGVIDGCNVLFNGEYFMPAANQPELVKFEESYAPEGENVDKKKAPPLFRGKKIESVWLSNPEITPEQYAKTVVAKMIEWCTLDENGKTALQIFDKDADKKGHSEYKNATFKDFAILARSRTEMEIFEETMRSVGVPYTRYKDCNLFRSRECAEWIALFRAINAPDFSSWNRQLLSEALITDFFKDVVSEKAKKSISKKEACDGLLELHYAESKEFDNPQNAERMQLAKWRSLALKFRYAEMLEQIYQDTGIEQTLMNVKTIQGMTRLRQIGNYAVDYLYSHRCSIDDLVRHLEGLARYEEIANDENGDLVEKGSDFEAVQVMTIHASKGLEFPVVISAAGFKKYNDKTTAPYIYHSAQDDSIHMGFGSEAKSARKAEELEEWKRLFYVDFTRASSILVLPQYKKWYETGRSAAPEYTFLKNAIEKYRKNDSSDKKASFKSLTTNCSWDAADKYMEVVKILAKPAESNVGTKEEALARMSALQKALPKKAMMQYSYSSLSGREEPIVADTDESRTEKDGSDISEQRPESTEKVKMSRVDLDVVILPPANAAGVNASVPDCIDKDFPRGSKVGNALHNVLERARFQKFGKDFKTLDDILEKPTPRFLNAVEEEFKAESLPIATHPEWNKTVGRMVWNTLNAELPEIAGNSFTGGEPVKLTTLPLENHKPEVQFGLNADFSDVEAKDSEEKTATQLLRRLCKGFIDLLFVHEINGQKYYSILDWKSDALENYNESSVKEKVDNEYSVQRVLYSYCLIQWLKQFYGKGTAENLDEEHIFNNHFGGIYYAFLRGTDGQSNRGIYAQTWKDYAALESAYKNVKELMNRKKV